ncbi:glycosyltransferase [Phytobacter sp. V91]|uniref:glycosyltransferase n=1 Tax=Phytobacter sp. V91 TaxID=3369425 RepID=UPI003F627DD4
MSKHDLVSILIPAYKADFFEEALLSALNQDWGNIEIIVCDDSDNDSIHYLCKHYSSLQKRDIFYYKNERRLLKTGNILRCLSFSRGKYIKFLYDDDTLQAHCITRLVEALQNNPNVVLASSRRTRIDEKGNKLPDIAATAFPFNQDAIINGHDLISFLCDHKVNFIGEPSVFLCYRDDLIELGDQIFNINNEEMPYFTDVALMVKLFRKGDLAFLCESLSSIRILAGKTSQMATSQQSQVDRTYSLMPKLIKELGWYKGNKEDNQFVRVTPMSTPDKVLTENLFQALLASRHQSLFQHQSDQFTQWLGNRHLPEQLKPFADEFQKTRKTQNNLFIFIEKNTHSYEAVHKTLASINNYSGYGLIITPLIIEKNSNLVPTINQYLADNPTDWVMFCEAGETILASGMLMFDLALEDAANCDAIYGDEFYQFENYINGTALRPDFNLDMLLSYPSEMARHWIFRVGTLLESGGFDTRYSQAWQFEYIVRLIEMKGTQFAGHLPEPFVIAHSPQIETHQEELHILTRHLHNRGYPNGQVETTGSGMYALCYQHAEQPLVSILIPTKDQLDILIPCVTTLLEKTRYQNYEIIIIDNNSETIEAQEWLASIATKYPERLQVLAYPHPFNYAAINNMAARVAKGEYLLLLNNDTEIVSSTWLDNLMNHAQRPEVGITGAKLLYPGGAIQHAGVVMGLHGPASHPFNSYEQDTPGYMNRLHIDQNYSVVTAACLLIRKSVYEQVGGMDEHNFKVSYNDVDLCLKVREAGYLTVWTPHSVVIHIGNVSQIHVDKTKHEQKIIRLKGEQDVMYSKWLPIITNDPAYNPNLYLGGDGYEFILDSISTWQPLHWKPLPTVLAFPLSNNSDSAKRIIYPLELMKAAAMVDGLSMPNPQNYPELARYAPTTVIVQQQITPLVQEWLHRLKTIVPTFTVFDMDEYLPAMKPAAALKANLPKDILSILETTLQSVHRVIVPTEVMAEHCNKLHDDVCVMETLLSPTLWSNLNSLRGIGKKPRVCWAGSAENNAELEIIHKVIAQMANHVEWIFLGYCPPSLRRYVTEIHARVTPERYPHMLASLNLDLAIVIRTDNPWSNTLGYTQLLEFGACGVPVICSNVIGFRNDLKVTRVENRAKEWYEAIEMHIGDLDATWKLGDILKSQVQQRGMLQGEQLLKLAQYWLPV